MTAHSAINDLMLPRNTSLSHHDLHMLGSSFCNASSNTSGYIHPLIHHISNTSRLSFKPITNVSFMKIPQPEFWTKFSLYSPKNFLHNSFIARGTLECLVVYVSSPTNSNGPSMRIKTVFHIFLHPLDLT